MQFEEWIGAIPIQSTPKGARLDLRLYVYPDGHGDFCAEDENGHLFGDIQPVNSASEAQGVLVQLWKRAMRLRDVTAATVGLQQTLAEQLGDLIGSVPELPPDMAQQHDHYLHGAPKR